MNRACRLICYALPCNNGALSDSLTQTQGNTNWNIVHFQRRCTGWSEIGSGKPVLQNAMLRADLAGTIVSDTHDKAQDVWMVNIGSVHLKCSQLIKFT